MTLDIGALKAENDRLSTESQAGDYLANFVKMPEGNGALVLRLLPPAPEGAFEREKNPFYCSTRIHRVNNKSCHCPKELDGSRWKGDNCPICKYYNWLWQESEKKSPEEANQMQAQARKIKPIERYYYNVIVRSVFNEQTQQMEDNVGPKILSVGKTLHKMIIRAIVGDKSINEAALGDVTHPTNGRDFKLIKTMRQSGRESYPNYSDSKFLDPSPLGTPDQSKEWMEGLHDIASLRSLRPEEELKHELKVHLGLVTESQGSGFDPTEFQTAAPSSTPAPAPAVTDIVTEPVTTETTTTAATAAVDLPSSDETESMADDDFLAQLKELSD